MMPNAPEAQFPVIPGHSYTGHLNELRLLDHSVQPSAEGAAYSVLVVAKDPLQQQHHRCEAPVRGGARRHLHGLEPA